MRPNVGPRRERPTAKMRAVFSLILLAGLSAVAVWAAPVDAGQATLRDLLPSQGSVPGWPRDGEPREFAGEDLFIYIDGGAEIYQEYGFRRVVLQDYRNTAGKSVSLEIFEMETPAAAYGIFMFKKSGKGKTIPLGSAAELEDYYLNFWKGRFLVTLTGFDDSPESAGGLVAVAEAVDSKIREEAAAPDLVSALPEKGLKPGSVKYLRGLLGLNNIYPFYTARGLDFAEAVAGAYDHETMLIVMDYSEPAVRASAWSALRAYLDGAERFKRGRGDSASSVFVDGQGRSVVFRESGSRLLVGISPDLSAALAIVGQAR